MHACIHTHSLSRARALSQACWRGYAVRQVLPALIAQGHRVCGIVERHRQRLLRDLHAPLHDPPPRTPDAAHSPTGRTGQLTDIPAHTPRYLLVHRNSQKRLP